jgi:hypothetical protein
MRPLIERAATISYLQEKPEEVLLWENGWKYKERPSLAKMLTTMNKEVDTKQAQEICNIFNSLTHGDPIGTTYNLVKLTSGGLGYSVGKTINEPEFCDFICFQSYLYLIVIMGRMAGYFPETKKEL